jgi:hypothetical protein
MKNPSLRSLRLSRETVRELADTELAGAPGAAITGNSCGCRTGFTLLEGCSPFSYVIALCQSRIEFNPSGCLPC